MSLLADVVAASGRGAGPATVARELGVDVGLVETVLDHAARVGLVQPVGAALGRSTCSACPPPGSRPLACTGCPLALRPPAPARRPEAGAAGGRVRGS